MATTNESASACVGEQCESMHAHEEGGLTMVDKANADLTTTDTEVTLSTARKMLILQSAWEITALCKSLREAVTPKENQEHFTVRALTARVKQLADITMSAIEDDTIHTDELLAKLRFES